MRGVVILNHGIFTARFCGKRKQRFGWYSEPGLAAPEAGLAAPEPRLPARAVEPSVTDPEPAGDAPGSATPFVGGRAITSSAFGVTHADMPDALLGDVECAHVMWFSLDGVAFRSR